MNVCSGYAGLLAFSTKLECTLSKSCSKGGMGSGMSAMQRRSSNRTSGQMVHHTSRLLFSTSGRKSASKSSQDRVSAGAAVTCTTHSLSAKGDLTYATLTVCNPAKLNIVDSTLLSQITAHCESLSTSPTLRAVVLTGAPPPPAKPASAAFIGGASILEMASIASPAAAREFITLIHQACTALRTLPVPVIARVDGYALGAGLEILASCDLRVCTRRSVFGMPEVAVGIPSVVEAALLPGLIGWGRTRRLVLLGERVGADVAERWGLVERVVDEGKDGEEGQNALDGAVEEWVSRIAEMGVEAIKSQKILVREWERCAGVEEMIDLGVEAFEEAWKIEDGREPKEMMGKFLSRKKESGR